MSRGGIRDALLNSEQEYTAFMQESNEQQSHAVQNLDLFLTRAYNYFQGKGFYCIILRQLFNILTVAFSVGFAVFMISFVDYDVLAKTFDWRQSILPRGRVHGAMVVCMIVFGSFILWQIVRFFLLVKESLEMKSFYRTKLQISEKELQTIEWREVVHKMAQVPRLFALKPTVSPLDVANRIMRKENYLIALINKDVLNLRIPLPFTSQRMVMTETLQWGLTYALFNYVFDANNEVKADVMRGDKMETLARRLKQRFFLIGVLGLILSPFIMIYLFVYIFFKYGEELRRTPGSILAAREWSPIARWKFREFNELPHYFNNRLVASYDAANRYVSQFPANLLTITARFVSFICGSILAVILVIGIWDQDVLLNADIGQYSLLWVAGVLGTVLTVCRSLIPGDNFLFNPATDMEAVIQYTHYLPKGWRGKFHSVQTHNEFVALFEYRLFDFLREMVSVLFTPFILMISLPQSAEDVLGFFHQFSVHVEGVGYICSFANFGLTKHGNEKYGAAKTGAKHMRSKQGKLEKSVLNFKANHPDWVPPQDSELMFGNLSTFIMSHSDTIAPTESAQELSKSVGLLNSDPDIATASMAESHTFATLYKAQQKYYDVHNSDLV